jgi:molecular chaperone GrpE
MADVPYGNQPEHGTDDHATAPSGGAPEGDEAGAAGVLRSSPEAADPSSSPVSTSGSSSTGSAASPGNAGGDSGSQASDQAGGEEADVVDADQHAIDGDIKELVAKNQEYLDLVRRTQADFENYRKRAQKQQDEAVVRELGGFVERLLPVLDACDAAAAQGQADAVEPIVSALFGALEREGLQRIDPKGETFDPTVAEAVVHEPGEGGAQVVAEVLRAGYRWQGRLLRPALVKVTD